MSFLSVALSYIYITTTFYNILLCQSGQVYAYIWQVKGHKILCHFINTADKWCLIDGQQLQIWFGTFTHTCTAHQGMVAVTCHLQGRQPLPWGRSPLSFEQISQTSFFSRLLLMWFGTFTHTCTAPWRMVVGTCCLQGDSPYHGEGPLWVSGRSAWV